ncbi:MAG TPA: HAD family hydrolase [Candidatus Eisenbacteria bacterium]|nr:HAD family hydrolase [Candidatus Eisenbacteria bacterium]
MVDGDGRFRALLVDAGGTLFPDSLPDAPGVRQVRARRLAAVLPELGPDRAAALLDELLADARAARDELTQRSDALIASRLRAVAPALAGRAGDVRRALSRPTGHEHPPFPGHRDLLLEAGRLGLRRVLVSNTDWVSDEDWVRWRMAERGLDGLLDDVVTSYSAGRRKPDRSIFDRALTLAGCPPEACVYVGDNEAKDVEPALALGMTVIRVAIQEPPTPSRAQRMVTSLPAAIEALRQLTKR